MIKTISKCLAIGLTLALALWLVGCGSSSGGGGTVAGGETVTRVANSYDEQCALCHGDGRVADVAEVHDVTSNSPVVTITAVRLVGGRFEVDVKILESTNPLIPIYIDDTNNDEVRNLRFTFAQLVPGAGGDSSRWQSYVNTSETWDVGDPGTNPAVPPVTVTQATYERASAARFSAIAGRPGEYTYQFSIDHTTVIDPVTSALLYNASNTHRISAQFPENVDNGFVDFVPNDLPALNTGPTRNIVVNNNCNECHLKLGFHGGDRIKLNFCVTCHNPGTTDANSGNTVDFKVMVHKIHQGADLPSGEYFIWGHNDNEYDFSTVEFPYLQFLGSAGGVGLGGVRNCTKCHAPRVPVEQSENWKLVPTMEACGSCHDRISFVDPAPLGFTLHPGGGQPDNSNCSSVLCHGPGGPFPAETVHLTLPQAVLDAKAKYEYNIISVTDTPPAAPGTFRVGPGKLPVITFSVTDPTNGDAPYDINNDPAFQPGASSNRTLRVLVGWFTNDPVDTDTLIKDYTHTGSGVTPAQPIRVDLLAGAVPNMPGGVWDGTFTAMATVPIPVDVLPVDEDGNLLDGSAVVAMEGHPAVEIAPGVEVRVPVKGAVQAVSVSDDPAAVLQPRRAVVDAEGRCDDCHGVVTLHGRNRTDNVQLCVLCHNANATDINDRLDDPDISLLDGKREEAIDFKYMIHAIHAGAASGHGIREKGIVISGDDFSHVRLPSGELNLRNCQGCHNSGTNELPIDPPALPTTVNTGADIADPDDDLNITPTASVCSSCHDSVSPAKTHMADNGGLFDFRAFTTTTSGGGGGGDQAALCGPGPVSAQPAGHVSRTDCCSCHSPN